MSGAQSLRYETDLAWMMIDSEEISKICERMRSRAKNGEYYIRLENELDERTIYFFRRNGYVVERVKSKSFKGEDIEVIEISWWKDP